MLVLTRKVEDRIQIGSNITITVLRIRGRSVQIGIEAPGSVEVLRGELAAAAELRTWGGEPKAAPSQRRLRRPSPPKEVDDRGTDRTGSISQKHRCSANG